MKEFFKGNRENFLEKMSNGDMALFFSGTSPQSTADSHYNFRADKNFYYLTGIKKESFILLMTKHNDKTETIIFVEKPDYDIEKWVGRKLTKEQVTEVSGIENVQYLAGFEAFLTRLIHTTKYDNMFLDLARMQFNGETTAAMKFAADIQKNYLAMNIKDAHKFMCELRMIKSDFEVEEIKKAVNLTKNGLEQVMKNLKPGEIEYTVEAEFLYSIRKNGADTNAFDTIAASGGNAVILHYVENDAVMTDGDLILMDLGAQYKQYASDITRTYPINGKYSERQKAIYNIVLKANEEVIKMMKPGIDFSEFNKKCTEVLAEGLIEIGLIKEASEVSKYYYHGVSHFMGLDVHDIGFRDVKTKPGMIFTVEPGLYIAEENIGIRIEDDILITEDGYINLSKDIIKSVEDIEAFMK
jgi:Xaa-Pro aminopeptidase